MEEMLIGVTDRSVFVFIPDPASTDGSGKTGLVAANLTVSYSRMETDNDATVTDVTGSLSDLSALTDAHTDWGLKEVSSTLAPGLYRLDIADAVFASGAWYAVVYVMITTSAAAATPKAFRLVAVNALDGVRQGMTALPNAAAEAAGGLYTRGTGAGQINQAANGQVDTNVTHAAGTAWGSGAITAASIATGAITNAKFAAGAIDAAAIADNAIDAGAIAADAITAAKIANGAIDAATFAADVDAEFLSYIVDDATRIDASALNTLSSHDPGETIMGATDLGTGAGLTSLASAANLATVAGYLDTEIAAILADTGTDGVVLSAATYNAIADALLVRANGIETGVTLQGALRVILSALVGLCSGVGVGPEVYRDVNDTKDRITATLDSDNNRLTIVLDLT